MIFKKKQVDTDETAKDRKFYKDLFFIFRFAVVFFAAIFIGLIVFSYFPDKMSATVITGTVVDKYPLSSGVYVVLNTSEKKTEIFMLQRSYWWLHFKPLELYDSLEKNETYRLLVTGWRVPALGGYRNIIEAKPIPPSTNLLKGFKLFQTKPRFAGFGAFISIFLGLGLKSVEVRLPQTGVFKNRPLGG